MPRLDDEHRVFIVTRQACFVKPVKVAEALKANFGVEITNLSQITYYDPTDVASSRDLGQEWVDLFWQTRQRFRDNVENIAIANEAFRLMELDAMLDHRVAQMDPSVRLAILEQAAKERGGLYMARVSPTEVVKDYRERGDAVAAAVRKIVTDAKQADHVLAEVKKILGSGST